MKSTMAIAGDVQTMAIAESVLRNGDPFCTSFSFGGMAVTVRGVEHGDLLLARLPNGGTALLRMDAAALVTLATWTDPCAYPVVALDRLLNGLSSSARFRS